MTRTPRKVPVSPALMLGAAITAAAGCGQPVADDDSATPAPVAADTDGPTISMSPIPDGQPLDTSVPVTVRLADPSGISNAFLYYRAPGTDYWGSSDFVRQEDDRYASEIPAAFVQHDGVDYYVEASDGSVNHNTSAWPDAGAASPEHFATEEVSGQFPYVATFDPPGGTEAWALEDTGWRGYVAGFDDGDNWHLCEDSSQSGAYSACHDHGSPYQTSPFLDYLVSPPIDLSNTAAADLFWTEFADYSRYAQHQLLVSTGHPNPASGDYVVLLDPLPVAPEAEGSWARSLHVDLSPFAGEPVVYIAFSYSGMWGDDWYLDDITIAEPTADLRFDDPVVEPGKTDPGGMVRLTIDVENAGLVASSLLTAVVTSPDGQVTVSPQEMALPGVAPGERVSVGPFEILVDAAHAEDVYIPVAITLSDDTNTWQDETRIQVGQPPVARIDISHEFEDDLQVYLGYGPPADPDLRITVQEDEGEDSSGTFHWDVDISGYASALPPNSTSNRWFLEVWDDSIGNTGRIEAFQIQIGGELYVCTGLPEPIPDDGTPVIVYIPGRPELELRTAAVDPAPAAPGATEELRVILNNTSSPPQGTLTGELHGVSTDIDMLEGGPMTMTYTAVDSSDDGTTGIISHDLPFRFRVADTHVDSTPVLFNLLITDEVDIWSVPIVVDVPYPVLGGLGLEIEDTSGKGATDSALEPGETTGLRLRVRNSGGLPTFAQVEAHVRILSDDGAGAYLEPTTAVLYPDPREDDGVSPNPETTPPSSSSPAPTPTLLPPGGPIPAGGGGKSDLLSIGVSSGSPGDRVELEVTLSDGTLEWMERRTLVLSETPWNPLTASDDPQGDADDYPIDFAAGTFRLSGSLLDMGWTSHATFDIDDTYLYGFISSRAEYQYAIVFVYGEARLYRWYEDDTTGIGYWYRRYSPPASLSAVQASDTQVVLSIDLADIGLTGAALFGGASAGACDGGSACDYAPDSASTGEGLTRFHW